MYICEYIHSWFIFFYYCKGKPMHKFIFAEASFLLFITLVTCSMLIQFLYTPIFAKSAGATVTTAKSNLFSLYEGEWVSNRNKHMQTLPLQKRTYPVRSRESESGYCYCCWQNKTVYMATQRYFEHKVLSRRPLRTEIQIRIVSCQNKQTRHCI